MVANPEKQHSGLDQLGMKAVAFERATGEPIEAYTGAELQGFLLERGSPGIEKFLARFHAERVRGSAQVDDGADGENVASFSIGTKAFADRLSKRPRITTGEAA